MSEAESEDIDLRVETPPDVKVMEGMARLDLGTLYLTLAPPDVNDLRRAASEGGIWSDLSQRYGDPSPEWHAVDARGIPVETTLSDLRGKWVLLDFWGLSCAPCLLTGIPKIADFYERNRQFRDRFEVIGICIDYTGGVTSIEQLDAALAPIVEHVWKGKAIPFPVVLDPTFQTWERFGIAGLGATVLVDPAGKLVGGDEVTLERILRGDPATTAP